MSAVARDTIAEFGEYVPAGIAGFLSVPTPQRWIEHALTHIDVLLIDHANCEKKAASTAVATLHRYADRPQLVYRMSRLAREELRHFEQVNALMAERGIAYRHVPASRYAGRLREVINAQEPLRLSDTLICGAFIEARSCERFAALVPVLDDELAKFYRGLLSSEARHFEHYLDLARDTSAERFDERVERFRSVECAAVRDDDTQFNFHSGPPPQASVA